MNVVQQITGHAGSLFDVVGVSQLSSGDSLLILGLESTTERNLDEFGRVDGKLQMYGFLGKIYPFLVGPVERGVCWKSHLPRKGVSVQDEGCAYDERRNNHCKNVNER